MSNLFYKFFADMRLPERMHKTDAGYDCYLVDDVEIKPFSTALINLGFGINMPKGCCAYINLRSSMAKKNIMAHNIPIDEGYKGPAHLIVHNLSSKPIMFKKGYRLCQVVIFKIYNEGPYMLNTNRNSGAFGSTDDELKNKEG